VVNFQALAFLQMLDYAPHSRMRDVLDVGDIVDLGVNNPVGIVKKGREISATEVAILVNCGSQNETPMLQVPSGVI